MSIWRIGWTRRWWVLVGLALVALVVAVGWGGDLVVIPSSDGPRTIRQMVVALLPCLIAPVLVDQMPTVSGTLVRVTALAWLERLGCVVVIFGVSAVAWWALPGLFPGSGWYEFGVACALTAIALAGTARWGSGGVLATCAVALGWLMAGDTVAGVMGFQTVVLPDIPALPVVRAAVSVTLCVLALIVALVLSSSSWWRAVDPGR